MKIKRLLIACIVGLSSVLTGCNIISGNKTSLCEIYANKIGSYQQLNNVNQVMVARDYNDDYGTHYDIFVGNNIVGRVLQLHNGEKIILTDTKDKKIISGEQEQVKDKEIICDLLKINSNIIGIEIKEMRNDSNELIYGSILYDKKAVKKAILYPLNSKIYAVKGVGKNFYYKIENVNNSDLFKISAIDKSTISIEEAVIAFCYSDLRRQERTRRTHPIVVAHP